MRSSWSGVTHRRKDPGLAGLLEPNKSEILEKPGSRYLLGLEMSKGQVRADLMAGSSEEGQRHPEAMAESTLEGEPGKGRARKGREKEPDRGGPDSGFWPRQMPSLNFQTSLMWFFHRDGR